MQTDDCAFTDTVTDYRPVPWDQIPDLGLYMDQVLTYMDRQLQPIMGEKERVFTPSMINNYVKMGLIARPVDKKYGREHLAQLLMISLLKPSATAEEMKKLLNISGYTDISEFYKSFCRTHEETIRKLAASLPLPSSMHCALHASVYRLLLNNAIVQLEDGENQHTKNEHHKKKP